jgi:hypothetical protein
MSLCCVVRVNVVMLSVVRLMNVVMLSVVALPKGRVVLLELDV